MGVEAILVHGENLAQMRGVDNEYPVEHLPAYAAGWIAMPGETTTCRTRPRGKRVIFLLSGGISGDMIGAAFHPSASEAAVAVNGVAAEEHGLRRDAVGLREVLFQS